MIKCYATLFSFFKKKKKKVIYCYTIKAHSRDQDSVKLKIIKHIVYTDDLVSQSCWFNLKVRARASGKLTDQNAEKYFVSAIIGILIIKIILKRKEISL
jgi:hypothetical protein